MHTFFNKQLILSSLKIAGGDIGISIEFQLVAQPWFRAFVSCSGLPDTNTLTLR